MSDVQGEGQGGRGDRSRGGHQHGAPGSPVTVTHQSPPGAARRNTFSAQVGTFKCGLSPFRQRTCTDPAGDHRVAGSSPPVEAEWWGSFQTSIFDEEPSSSSSSRKRVLDTGSRTAHAPHGGRTWCGPPFEMLGANTEIPGRLYVCVERGNIQAAGRCSVHSGTSPPNVRVAPPTPSMPGPQQGTWRAGCCWGPSAGGPVAVFAAGP